MVEFESCDKCKYSTKTSDEFPCNTCKHGVNTEDFFKPKTNADRIRSMSDEELAKFLVSIEKDTKNYRTWDSAPCCLLWLKSEAKE